MPQKCGTVKAISNILIAFCEYSKTYFELRNYPYCQKTRTFITGGLV